MSCARAYVNQGVAISTKAFDKKGPHAGKFSVKYKDDPNWWTHSLLREGFVMEKTSTGCCLGSRAVIPLEVTMTVSAGDPIFFFPFNPLFCRRTSYLAVPAT